MVENDGFVDGGMLDVITYHPFTVSDIGLPIDAASDVPDGVSVSSSIRESCHGAMEYCNA